MGPEGPGSRTRGRGAVPWGRAPAGCPRPGLAAAGSALSAQLEEKSILPAEGNRRRGERRGRSERGPRVVRGPPAGDRGDCCVIRQSRSRSAEERPYSGAVPLKLVSSAPAAAEGAAVVALNPTSRFAFLC